MYEGSVGSVHNMNCCADNKDSRGHNHSDGQRPRSGGDSRLLIFFGIAGALTILGVILGLALGSGGSGAKSGEPSKIVFGETGFSAGDISMANGFYTKVYKFKNDGQGVLEISKLETTCMCTEAKIRYQGKESPNFGMPGHDSRALWGGAKIAPGDEAELVVTFDPNAHGPEATGQIKRGIILYTNDQNNREAEVFFSANVTK